MITVGLFIEKGATFNILVFIQETMQNGKCKENLLAWLLSDARSSEIQQRNSFENSTLR